MYVLIVAGAPQIFLSTKIFFFSNYEIWNLKIEMNSNITNVSFTKFDNLSMFTVYRDASLKSITGDVCSF